MEEENSVAMDRISSLPESVLCHILSFLTTQQAVATSILSRRWRTVWTVVPILNLDDKNLSSVSTLPRNQFADIVDSVFSQRNTQCIRKLRLKTYYGGCEPFQVNAWVCSAVAGSVEELELSLSCFAENIDLPKRFFTCKTIVVLKLSGNINLNVPSSVHFPSLKSLDFMPLNFEDDVPVRRLLSGCPVLEKFSVDVDIMNSVQSSFRISSPSLKKLWVYFFTVSKLEINTPSLEYLNIQAASIEDDLIVNVQNVVEANLDVSLKDGLTDCVFKLFKSLHEIKFLSMSYAIGPIISATNLDLPEFRNVIRLELTPHCCDSNFLVNLLSKCPKLEVLVIEKIYLECYEPCCWTPPTSVPDCLSSHLTVFKFKGYRGTISELGLAAYILKSASLLRTTAFEMDRWLDSKEKLCIIDLLLMLPRASATCELAFVDEDGFH